MIGGRMLLGRCSCHKLKTLPGNTIVYRGGDIPPSASPVVRLSEKCLGLIDCGLVGHDITPWIECSSYISPSETKYTYFAYRQTERHTDRPIAIQIEIGRASC